MSIRHAGNRWYNISEDGGETWQPTTSTWYDITAPACNGDMIRYTSENQGHDKNRLLHSVPYGNCILPDGTIGLYVEEAYAGASGYSTVFYNFSLEWLTDGNDTFDPTGIVENQIQTESLKVYPVPASSFVTIEAKGMQTINIYNALGQMIKSVSVSNALKLNLDVSAMPNGLYFIDAVDVNGVIRKGRFVK